GRVDIFFKIFIFKTITKHFQKKTPTPLFPPPKHGTPPMPMITAAYATSRSEAGLKAAVAQAAIDLAAQVLRKDPKVTAVKVEAVDPADWFCAGHSLA